MARPRMAVTSWEGTSCWPRVKKWEDEELLAVNVPRRRKMADGFSFESLGSDKG